MRVILKSIVPLLLLALVPLGPAQAQDFPSRPVKLVVPYAAGGSSDLLGRLLGEKLSKLWGQQVVIENKPGAGGIIGTEFAARAEPDGYTLYQATDGPLTIATTLHKKPLPYDWKRDFAPVSMMAVGYQIIITSPKLPAQNLKDFITHARQNPGKLNYASIGIGSAPHLGAEVFLAAADIKMVHVPYRGSSAQAITALISGDVGMFFVGTSTAVPFVKAGTVHGLAVTSPRRIDSLAEVPTMTELGLPSVDNSLWFSILVPSKTPPAIVQKLHADIAKVVADPDYQKTLHGRGFDAQSMTPAQLGAFMEKDYQKFRVLIPKLGLSVE